MRVGILAPPWIPIPPPAYGGIEQVVALQAAELAARGHDVVLFAPAGSRIDGVEVVESQFPLPDAIGLYEHESLHISAILPDCDGLDVLIDHSSPGGLAITSLARPPVLHVIHGPILPAIAEHYRRVCRLRGPVGLVAISQSQRATAPRVPFVGVCHNAIDVNAASFSANSDGYLAFLGRMSPDKGVAEAIKIARAAGRELHIAAKCREPGEIAYFEREVAPHIGRDVVWLGEIGEQAKYRLLRRADALVFPIDWDEPFGLVMVEAMACGTPVLATRRGAVPEVVVDGLTGFIRDEPHQLIETVNRLDSISREACRAHVVDHFSGPTMARRYEELAGQAVAAARRTRTVAPTRHRIPARRPLAAVTPIAP